MFPGSSILTLRVNKGYYNAGNHFYDFPSISPEQDALSGMNSLTASLGGKPDLIVIGGGPLWGSAEHTRFQKNPGYTDETPVMFLGVGTRSDLSHPTGPNADDLAAFHAWIDEVGGSRFTPSSARDQATSTEMDSHGIRTYMTGCPVLHYVGEDIQRRDSDYFLITYRHVLGIDPMLRDRASTWLRKTDTQRMFPFKMVARSKRPLRRMMASLPFTSQFHANPTINKRIDPTVVLNFDLIKRLEDALGAKHVVMVHDYRDVSTLSEVAQGNHLNFVFHYDLESATSIYRHAKFVLTYRLHGELLAATTGTPFFHAMIDRRGGDHATTFDPQMRHHEWIKNLSGSTILQRVRSSAADPDDGFAEYNANVETARMRLNEFRDDARRSLGI